MLFDVSMVTYAKKRKQRWAIPVYPCVFHIFSIAIVIFHTPSFFCPSSHSSLIIFLSNCRRQSLVERFEAWLIHRSSWTARMTSTPVAEIRESEALGIWVCLKIVYPIFPMVLLITIPIKWLFHWEYTQHFQTNPSLGIEAKKIRLESLVEI